MVPYRWFDKSFSLIVNKGGSSSINFEHAWGDGVAVLRLFNELYKDASNCLTTCSAPPSVGGVTRLTFDLSDSMKNSIEAAKNEIESKTKKLSIKSLQYEKYGKNLLKKSKLSPDAILQLSIQVLVYTAVHNLILHMCIHVCMYNIIFETSMHTLHIHMQFNFKLLMYA